MDEKLRILLCEDDENLGMLLREYLQAKGYSAELCPDGEAGYKAFLKNKYDLCVLDVMMPKKDGFTLAQEIRQANAEIPIIFLTAKTLKEDILEGFKIGADDYITKPFSMEELTFRIEAILRRVRGKRNKESNIYKIGRFTFDTQKQILAIIKYSGGYIAAPSANTSGKPSPTVAKYVEEDMMGRIDAIIDGGEVGIGLESTIIDLTVTPPQILRPGYITQEKLSTVLGTVDTDTTILRADSGQAPKAPGMKYRHYAPRGELTIVEGTPGQVREYINRAAAADHTAGEKTGIIGTEEMLSGYIADVVKSVGSRKDEDSIARHLYTILREFDDEGVTKIYSEGFSTEGFGQAIMNRLLKAAGHKVVKL